MAYIELYNSNIQKINQFLAEASLVLSPNDLQRLEIELKSLYDIQEGYLEAEAFILGRTISRPIIVNNPEVERFVLLGSITDSNTVEALDILVTSLKEEEIWNDLVAVYPFVLGDTAASPRLNLKDVDLYRINRFGNFTYDNGIAFDGESYGDTTINLSEVLTEPNPNITIMINSDNTPESLSSYEYGVLEIVDLLPNGVRFVASDIDGNSRDINLRTESVNTLNVDANGIYSSNKNTDSESTSVFKNGELFYNYTSGGVLPNANLLIGAVLNKDGETETINGYSVQKVGYFSVGNALSSEKLNIYHTIINDFKNRLGR